MVQCVVVVLQTTSNFPKCKSSNVEGSPVLIMARLGGEGGRGRRKGTQHMPLTPMSKRRTEGKTDKRREQNTNRRTAGQRGSRAGSLVSLSGSVGVPSQVAGLSVGVMYEPLVLRHVATALHDDTKHRQHPGRVPGT